MVDMEISPRTQRAKHIASVGELGQLGPIHGGQVCRKGLGVLRRKLGVFGHCAMKEEHDGKATVLTGLALVFAHDSSFPWVF